MAGSIKRLFSFGFLFGARDEGAVEMTEDLSENMDTLSDNVARVGRSSNMLQRFGNAIGALNLHQLTGIRDTLSSLADRAGALGPQAQDTAAESFGAQFSAQFRSATAGMGELTEQMNRYRGAIGGTAYDLGVDAGDLTQGIRRIVQSGRSLEEYGLSVRGMAGSMQAGILSGEQLGTVLTSLSEGYDLGAEGAQRVLDTITALGERGGAGAEAARALPQILQSVDDIVSSFPAGAAPGVDSITESITRLALASQDRLGGDFNAAMNDAIQTFSQLGGQRRELRNLVSGIGSDFPQLAQEIGIASGDIDGALQSVMSDPLTFASHMQQLMSTLDASDPRAMRLMASLEQMPASFRFLVTGGDEAAAALTRAQGPIENVEGAFNRMGRSAAASGRTFGESMERLRDNFETQVNRMTTLSNREVLGRQREAYQRLAGTLNSLRESNGPIGGVVQAMLDFRRHGVIGLTESLRTRLLPSLGIQLPAAIENAMPLIGELGSGLMEGATEMGPLILAMTQLGGMMPGLGGAVGLLLNPWTLLIGGLVAAIVYWDELQPLLEDGVEFIGEMADRLADWVDQVDWVAMGERIVEGFERIFASFGEGGTSRRIMRSLAGSALQILSGFGDMLSGLADGIFGGTGGGIMSRIFGFLFESTNIGNLLRAIESGDWGDIIFEGLFTVLNSAMMGWPGRIRALFGEIFGADVIGGFWEDVVQPTLADFADFWDTEINPIIDEAILIWEELSEVAMEFWTDNVQPMLEDLKEEVINVFVRQILPRVRRVWRDISRAATRMWQRHIRPMLFTLLRVSIRVWADNRRRAIRAFEAIAVGAVTAFNNIQTAIGTLVRRWRGWRETLRRGWAAIGTAVRNSLGMAVAFADHHFTNLVEGWERGMLRIERGFRRLPIMITEFVRDFLTGDSLMARAFRAAAEVAGVTIGTMTGNIDEQIEQMNRPIRAIDEQLEEMDQNQRDRQRDYDERIAQMQQETRDAADATVRAYDDMNAAVREYQEAQAASLQQTVSSIRGFSRATEGVLNRFADRYQQFVTDIESGALADRARARRQQSALESARPIFDQLEEAARSGQLGAEQYEAAFQTVERAVREGQEFNATERRNLLDQLGIDPDAEAEGADTDAGGGRRRRAQGRGAGGSETPGRRQRQQREAAREAQEAEREAERALMISAFGTEAVRQLRSVFGGSPNPTPNIRRPLVGPQPGEADT